MHERPELPRLTVETTPRFAGEDTRTTSRKEIWGWYFYGWAAEVFVVCGVGSFIPITLEQLARENGHTPAGLPCKGSEVCVIPFLGYKLNTASFAMYTFSLSVAFQALLLISISAAADHGRYRKSFLLFFAFLGATATMCFILVTSKVYFVAAILAIVANTCIGSSFVLLNSFLPLLVRHHPQLHLQPPLLAVTSPSIASPRFSTEEREPDHDSINSASLLLPSPGGYDMTVPFPKSASATSPQLQLSTKISSNGIGIGYVAAAIVQVLAVVIVYLTGGTTFSLRLVLFVVGLWWMLFSIPTALWLRPRPGPQLSTSNYFSYAWKSLGKTIMRARRLQDVLLFLAAWFLLSDGIATVSGTAVLFAKTTLGMKPAALAMINVVVMVSGVVGALSWSWVSRALRLRPAQTILACCLVFELIPFYALLGYLPTVKRWGVIGLQQPWEMYPLAAVYGLVLGGVSSYCRALFGELVPPGFEAAFFALYAITDKGSSIFGPAIVGAITDATGDIRPAFWFLALLIGLPVPLMFFVDVDRGKAAGAALAKELDTQISP